MSKVVSAANKSILTDKQLNLVLQLRGKGASWDSITEEMVDTFETHFSPHQLKAIARRYNLAINDTKPVVTKKRLDPKPNPVHRDTQPQNNRVILCVSDMHTPYEHPDTVAFLTAIKKKYNPTRIIIGGDEIDSHSMSFHDSDPDLMNAGDELEEAIKRLKPIYKLFPVAEVLESNHGSMAYRKGKHHGIARKYLRHYNEVLDAPKGWTWHDNLRITLPTGQMLYVTHGVKSNGIQLAQSMGCCVLQFHFHTKYNITYGSSPSQLYWSLQAGCLIDDKSLAFAYNKTTEVRPIIGIAIIIDGLPRLLPMLLDANGRWNKYIP